MCSLGKAPVALRRRAHRMSVRLRSRFIQDTRGVTAIEFGVAFPVFIMMILGTLEFGRALETRNQMSHALSQAVRVVNLDANQTPAAIATLMAAYLDDFDADDLNITTSNTTISDIDYMQISVNFPFEVTIPFSTASELTLNVQTRTAILSATQ